jgi:hypothetical protein
MKTKPDWKTIQADAQAVLKGNRNVIEAFRTRMCSLFTAMLKESSQPFKRRPPISLRLICDGDPPAKLISLPGWDVTKKTVDPSWLRCELGIGTK